MEFGTACEVLSWNHRTSTPHRSKINGIAERAVRRVKEGTSAVLPQSAFDERWWSDSMEIYEYLRNVQELLASVQRDGVLKACLQQAAADPRGSRTFGCVSTFRRRVAHAGGEGRINVLPWYRLVGVVSTSSETHRREDRAARNVVRGRLSSPIPAEQPAVFRWQ